MDEENEQTGATPEEDETVLLYVINQDNGKDEAIVTLIINNQLPVGFKLDTGVQANIIPKSVFDQLNPKPELWSTNQRLTSYCGAKIPVLGACDLKCSHKTSSTAMHKFYIVDSWSAPITSYQSSISLDLIKLILNVNSGEPQMCIQDQCKKVFDGISRLEGECNIHLKDGLVLNAYPARRVPEPLKNKLLQELIQMKKDGIIEKVNEPTEWVNSMVMMVEKKVEACSCA